MSDKFQAVRKAKQDYENALRKISEKDIHNRCKSYLLESGNYAISWRQGTPSFNDGDACHFALYDDLAVMPDASSEWEEDYEDEALNKLYIDLESVEDHLEALYGNAEITVTLDRFETDHYDCW